MSLDSSAKPSNTSVDYVVRSVIAGGVAGGVAKTAVAPLERIKILFQTHHKEFVAYSGTWRGVLQSLQYIWRTQGVLGLYRGHSLTLARAVPHAAVGYTVYEGAKKVIMPTPALETSFRRTLVGAVAGVSVLPITYPFELIRVRMAMEASSDSRPNLRAVLRSIYSYEASLNPVSSRGTILHFYRGFVVSAVGTVPYRGGIFLVWETLNARARETLSPEFRARNRHTLNLAIGAIAGTSAQIVTYPLEVIRRMQQASGYFLAAAGMQPMKDQYAFKTTVLKIWRTSGWRGYYAGLGIGLVKQVPLHSISLSVWQAMKQLLDI
ncbi:mitochondrial carrier domain-containing protein [Schizophyllum amplum]|uniref:Mitochondrial carrier domain-containing protein n=1 Tax=Schizophyllum amplum TaxID=97359 RepID=A0A550C9H5_9AGAR|nr:mitochondrial carrier domain-containing protein [Auriculariopsis ampla]